MAVMVSLMVWCMTLSCGLAVYLNDSGDGDWWLPVGGPRAMKR